MRGKGAGGEGGKVGLQQGEHVRQLPSAEPMNLHGLSATDHGYVAWNGGEIFYEYSQPEQSNSPSLSM